MSQIAGTRASTATRNMGTNTPVAGTDATPVEEILTRLVEPATAPPSFTEIQTQLGIKTKELREQKVWTEKVRAEAIALKASNEELRAQVEQLKLALRVTVARLPEEEVEPARDDYRAAMAAAQAAADLTA